MKRIPLFLCILALLCLVGCHKKETLKIGISQCSEDDWRIKMNNEILREMNFHPEASVEIRSANDNSEKQIEDIRYFIDNGFDIIVVAPNEAETLTPVIKEAYGKGIPVVVFDRAIKEKYFTAFQGADNYGIGAEAAHYILSHVNENPRILEVYGLEGSTPAEGRHSGFHDYMMAHDSSMAIISVPGFWNYEEAYGYVDSVYSGGGRFDAIYAHNDRMAIAAAEVAGKYESHPLIVGVDAAPEIGMKAVADGKIDATFLYPTEGAQLVKTALGILHNEDYDSILIIPVNPAVTRDNVGVLLIQNEELVRETEHLENLKLQLDDYWHKHSAQNAFLIAAIIIIILSAIVIFIVLKAVWDHKKSRQKLALQNEQLEGQKAELTDLNAKLNEATQSKLTFFTNVSHDLRTPLTLIAEPVAQLSEAKNLTQQQHNLIKIADKNIRILKRLINQILDFRKFENDRLELNLIEVNLGTLILEWTSAFDSLAKKRHLEITTDVDESEKTNIAVDAEKIERIFFNLLSNAVKFTPDNGNINISCRKSGENIEIRISDSGKGIKPEDLKNIFNRFYQVDHVNPTGSGIGLALAKSFTEMHGGNIEVESEPGKGSMFLVTLPVVHVADTPENVESRITGADVISELDRTDKSEMEINPEKPVLLVIDDNEDICNMIVELLGEEYNVLTASNGKSGLKMASKYVPDVVVCDVMMPVMDGLECCRLLKEEVSTSHIPVLMLTACSLDEQRVEGFESGADGYVAKPFNLNVLKSNLSTLIKNRKRIKSLWKSEQSEMISRQDSSVSNLTKGLSEIDNDFYRKFLSLVKENISDPELSVDGLARELGLARSQFYRKIKALTNFSPVELLRQIRLKHARELLMTTEMSISEIGYGVGFSSAAYFTKCYRDEYGETPSQLRERLGHTS